MIDDTTGGQSSRAGTTEQQSEGVRVVVVVVVVVAGPEQLKLKEFEQALLDDVFWARVCGLGFDKVHLLNVWGP